MVKIDTTKNHSADQSASVSRKKRKRPGRPQANASVPDASTIKKPNFKTPEPTGSGPQVFIPANLSFSLSPNNSHLFAEEFGNQKKLAKLESKLYESSKSLPTLNEKDFFAHLYAEKKISNRLTQKRHAALLIGEHSNCLGTGEMAKWVSDVVRRSIKTGIQGDLSFEEKLRIKNNFEIIQPRLEQMQAFREICRHISVTSIMHPEHSPHLWIPSQMRCSLIALSQLKNFRRVALPCDFIMQIGNKRPSHATSIVIEHLGSGLCNVHHFETNGQNRPSLKRDPWFSEEQKLPDWKIGVKSSVSPTLQSATFLRCSPKLILIILSLKEYS